MTPLRLRMIEDMTLAGLAAGTQAVYIQAVRRLAAHYRRSPDQLSEDEVRAYLLALRERGVALGTESIKIRGVAGSAQCCGRQVGWSSSAIQPSESPCEFRSIAKRFAKNSRCNGSRLAPTCSCRPAPGPWMALCERRSQTVPGHGRK